MTGDRLERPTFDVISGDDRTQVNAHLAEQGQLAIQARDCIQGLQATVSAFEDLAESSQRDRDRAHELLRQAEADRDATQRKAAEIIEAAHLRAAELYEASRLDRREADQLAKQAQAERAEAERQASEVMETARAEAAILNEESRRDREYASGQVDEARQKLEMLVEEAREQVEWFVDEVNATAAEGLAEVMNGSRPHLDEICRGLDRVEDQRQSVLGDLSRLRRSLDDLAVGMLRAG